jgi:PhnB protein
MAKPIPDDHPQVMPYLIVDGAFARAVQAAIKPLRAVEDRFHGDRSGQFEDTYGHRWNVAAHGEGISEEEMQRRAATVGGV